METIGLGAARALQWECIYELQNLPILLGLSIFIKGSHDSAEIVKLHLPRLYIYHHREATILVSAGQFDITGSDIQKIEKISDRPFCEAMAVQSSELDDFTNPAAGTPPGAAKSQPGSFPETTMKGVPCE